MAQTDQSQARNQTKIFQTALGEWAQDCVYVQYRAGVSRLRQAYSFVLLQTLVHEGYNIVSPRF